MGSSGDQSNHDRRRPKGAAQTATNRRRRGGRRANLGCILLAATSLGSVGRGGFVAAQEETPAPTVPETPAPVMPTPSPTPGPTTAAYGQYIHGYLGEICEGGVPCYASGCGVKEDEPCIRLLSNCDFTLQGYADGTKLGLGISAGYTSMVTRGMLPMVTMPRMTGLETEAAAMTELPVVLSDGGTVVTGCKVSTVKYQKCVKGEADAVTCSWQTLYTNFRHEYTTKGLNASEPGYYRIDGQFGIVTDDDGGNLVAVSPVLPQMAPSLYAALGGGGDATRSGAVKLGLTCNSLDDGAVSSCVMFDVKPTPTSPNLVTTAVEPRYRFEKPMAPAFQLVDHGIAATLNVDNPIVLVDGQGTPTDCKGNQTEYQGEDGLWYGYYVGSDGLPHQLSEAFYAQYHDVVMPAFSSYMTPALNSTLTGRSVRMRLDCHGDGQGGWLYFGIGVADGVTYPIYTCKGPKNYDFFCRLSDKDAINSEDEVSAARPAAVTTTLWAIAAAAAAAVLTARR